MRKAAEPITTRSIPALFKRRRWLILGLAIGLSASLRATTTTWPSLVNFQGQLTDGSGNAVSDTAYSIQFLIYDSPTAGTLQWSEVQPTVNVSKGLFNVVLGSVTPVSLTTATAYGNDLWLAVKVGTDPEMTPRQQLLPSVYSLNAQRLGGASIGTGPGNIPQLNVSGQLPSSMIAGGSISVPLDMSGPGGIYNLHVNNTSAAGKGIVADSSTGIAISATTASLTVPTLYAEGARYGVIAQTDDSSLGVALQAQGPGSAYASLIDRVNGAQVYGKASAGPTYGVLGTNSAAVATAAGVGGNSPSGIGVSGTGGTYGVYGASASGNGIEGISSSGYGVYASSPSGTGLYATGNNNFGVYAISSGYTGVYGTGGVYGVYGQGPTAVYGSGTSIGVLAQGGAYGVSSTGSSYGVFAVASGSGGRGVWADAGSAGINTGVYGQTESILIGSAGVYGTANGTSGLTYGVFGNSASNAGTGVEGIGLIGVKGISTMASGNGVYGSSSDPAGSGGYFVNTAASGMGTAVTADGYTTGLSTTANNGYAVEASGLGGGEFFATSDYGLNVSSVNSNAMNVNSTNSWGMEVQAYNGYASVNYSSYGIYSSSTSGNGLYSYGSTNGIYAATGAGSNGEGVYGNADCATCYGIYAINNTSTGVGTGLYAEGYTVGVSATARSGSAYKAYGSTGFYATASSGGINFYSDPSNNPTYGFYHYAAPTTTSFGIYDLNNNATGHAAFIYNLSPAATDAGDALYVRGKIRATDVSGKYTGGATAVASWVVSNSMVEATSVIIVTPITAVADPLFVSSVSAGSFTVGCDVPTANLSFFYWIVSR